MSGNSSDGPNMQPIGTVANDGTIRKPGDGDIDTSPFDLDAHIAAVVKEVEKRTDEPEPAPEPSPKIPAPASEPKPEEPKPEPTSEPEPSPESKLSARERFIQSAQADREKRQTNDKLKARESDLEERERRVESVLKRMEHFDKDPIGFIEHEKPKLFEQMVEHFTAQSGEKPKPDERENAYIKKLEEKITGLEKLIEKTSESVQSSAETQKYTNILNDTKKLLLSDNYKAIHNWVEAFEEMTGTTVDLDRAIAYEFDSFKSQYGRELTPDQIAEIMLETATERLEKTQKSDRLKKMLGISESEPPQKGATKPKSRPKTGQTVTNRQQTSSRPAETPDMDSELDGLDGEERIQRIAEMAAAGKYSSDE